MTDFKPNYVGQIDEGILGNLDLYIADLPSTVKDIYQARFVEGKRTTVLDEFYFLAPSNNFGTKSETKTASGLHSFVSPKLGEEPLVLHKAYFHYVGHYFEIASQEDVDIKSTFENSESAWFSLPKIPSMMVSKLDQFFRSIDNQWGTEAIVILTYNFTHSDSNTPEDGWGFSVPEQTNTSVHCNYDKQSIKESLPQNVEIVGTIHSHPGMAAYSSSVDKEDQTGFDGLHITFGWQTQNDDKTEFHAELVRGSNFYNIDPAFVMDLTNLFEFEVDIDNFTYNVDPKMVRQVPKVYEVPENEMNYWSSNVKKGVPANSVSSYGWHQNNNFAGPKGGGTPKALSPRRANHDISDLLPTSESYPKGIVEFIHNNFPDPTVNHLFFYHNSSAEKCLMCDISWTKLNIKSLVLERRQCLSCGIFILFENETIAQMNTVRINNGYKDIATFLDFQYPFVKYDPNKSTWDTADAHFYKLDEKGNLIEGDNPKVLSSL